MADLLHRRYPGLPLYLLGVQKGVWRTFGEGKVSRIGKGVQKGRDFVNLCG